MKSSKKSARKPASKARVTARSEAAPPSLQSMDVPEKVQLNVHTENEATEVFIINGQFQLADRAVGRHNTFELEPGIYKIKVREGSQLREEYAVLAAGSKPVERHFKPLNFATPAPLHETATTEGDHDHMRAASETSRTVRVKAGTGSFIFVFVRDWTPSEQTNTTPSPFRHPARGLTLLDESGRQVSDFASQSKGSLKGDPWAGCNVEVEPGAYRLRLELATGDTIEQILMAVEGWQTQFYALQKSYGTEPDDRRANLSGASVFMVRRQGRHAPSRKSNIPDEEERRLVELARQGLMNRRKVLSPQVEAELLNGKCRNPMLGIYGAHLILLKDEPNLESFHTVIESLRDLVGQKHPDVEALSLALSPAATHHVFNVPPMLKRSWTLVVQASAARPKLVPMSSLASQVASQMWGDEPWFLWMSPAQSLSTESFSAGEKRSKQPSIPEEFEELLVTQLKQIRQSESPVKRSASPQKAEEDLGAYLRKTKLDKAHYQTLVQTLGLPRANVDQLLKSYKRKG